MPEIILTQEQTEVVAQARDTVQVRDPKGNVLGYIEPPDFMPEEIAEAKRALASNQPRFTTAQVLEYLRSLEQK
jgi:hypothetical protein